MSDQNENVVMSVPRWLAEKIERQVRQDWMFEARRNHSGEPLAKELFWFGALLRQITDSEPVLHIPFHLKDVSGNGETLAGSLRIEVGGLTFHFDGYGDFSTIDGLGEPLAVELYEGKLRLIVWPDINEQEPQVIDMEQARESNRKEEAEEEEEEIEDERL